VGLESRAFNPKKLSCITFGTPPVLFPNITQDLKSKIHSNILSSPAPAAPLLLAIINDRDVVSRLDEGFKLKLFELLGEYARAQKTGDPPHPRFKIPTMNLWNLGDKWILKRPSAQETRCYTISDDVFQCLLYVSVMQHKMVYYISRCQDMLESQTSN
jgi:hypothetical protein